MKVIKLFLVAIVVIFASTAHADGEYIGHAFRAEGGACGVFGDGWSYEGPSFTQYSNGKRGHATFKCKLDLVGGDPVIYFSEWDSGSFPIGGSCYTVIDISGNKGMWTSQCFGVWNDGD